MIIDELSYSPIEKDDIELVDWLAILKKKCDHYHKYQL